MRRPIKTVNLKESMPTLAQAGSRLRSELRLAAQQGCAAVKFIHGYGSHGVGGDLRIALQAELAMAQRNGEISAFIAGEDWRISNEAAWALLKKCPELRRDPDLGRGNKGISIVVL